MQQQLLSKIKDFGINTYEAKLWIALLSKGTATAGELSDIANVPRSRTYDVLESLERKGFIILKIGKPIKYIAVPPAEVIERVKKNIIEQTQQQTETLNTLKESKILTELNNIHKTTLKTIEPTELTGMIRGTANIIHHYNTQIRNAQKNIQIITTEEGLITYYNHLLITLKKAKERGTTIKITTQKTLTTEKIASELKNNFIINYTTHPVGNYCIIDETTTNMTILEKTHDNICIWINTPFIAQSLTTLFNKIVPTSK